VRVASSFLGPCPSGSVTVRWREASDCGEVGGGRGGRWWRWMSEEHWNKARRGAAAPTSWAQRAGRVADVDE
jgi:hypothetical protein